MTTLFDQLCAIATDKAPLGYLTSYARDLYDHDRKTLAAPHASKYLWMLRPCGTALFPVAIGHDSHWATYWLDQGNTRDAPTLAYLIDVTAGTVRPISYDKARQIAATPAPDGRRIVVSLDCPRQGPAPY